MEFVLGLSILANLALCALFAYERSRIIEGERAERSILASRIQAPEATAAVVLDQQLDDERQYVEWDNDEDLRESLKLADKIEALGSEIR